jgi:hypothetical protein
MRTVAAASLVGVLLSACSSAPAGPSSSSALATTEFDGVWTGKTTQGLPASFTIANRTITAITVPYEFNGCSGVKSFPGLSVSIAPSSGPMPVQVQYTSGPSGGPDQTSVFFVFYPNATAVNVTASFFNYTGCGNNSTFLTAFKGNPPNHTGEWSGSTSQGAPIAFVVADLTVTSITLGFNFGGCAGTTTYANLALRIAAAGSGVGFSHASGLPEIGDYTLITGFFRSATAADGMVVFKGYPGCADQVAMWTATLR